MKIQLKRVALWLPLAAMVMLVTICFTWLAMLNQSGDEQVSVKGSTNPLQTYEEIKVKMVQTSDVPVVLPAKLPRINSLDSVYPYVKNSDAEKYNISLDVSEDCRGVSNCSVGFIRGKISSSRSLQEEFGRPQDPLFKPSHQSPNSEQELQLKDGIIGHYFPYMCGASCNTSKIVWERDQYRYVVGIKGGILSPSDEIPYLVSLADEAITNSSQ